MNKVIFIDWHWFVHSKGFFWMDKIKEAYNLKFDEEIDYNESKNDRNLKLMPATYYGANAIISSLKRIGIKKEDKIIVTIDCKNNWRKEILQSYKKKRRKLLPEIYNEFDWLLNQLRKSSGFYFLRLPPCEADDIIAYGCQYYKNKQIIIVSPDSDFFQLLVLDNVRIFSPHSHPTVRKAPYKILDLNRKKEIQKAYRVLDKKIKREKTDGLIEEVITIEDDKIRELLVNLIDLPDFIQARVKQALDKINGKVKSYNLDLLPFPSIRKRFPQIYDSKDVITYEDCRKKLEKKQKKAKKKRRKK